MKITALNLRGIAIGLAVLVASPALMAQTLQVVANNAPVSQASPYKSLTVRLFTSYSQLGYVEATLNFDSARFSVYSVTNYMPHECRVVGNKLTVSARGPSNGLPFPIQSNVDFCQLWLKLKPGAALGTSQVYYSPAWMYSVYGDYVVGVTNSTSITVQ